VKFKNGWIKLHRKVLESTIAIDGHKPNHERMYLWIWLLCNANIFESKIKHNGKDIIIPPGALAFSDAYISKQTHLTSSKIRTALSYMDQTGRIELKRSNRGSYLIINKWEEYQILREQHVESVSNSIENESKTNQKPIENQSQQTEERKKIRKKNIVRKKKVDNSHAVSLDFLDAGLQDFISGVSDNIRLRWKSHYCNQTIAEHLQRAADWSEAKGKKPLNVALLMNTFFKDTEHDKWKDEPGGCDPEEKAVSDMLKGLLEQGKREINTDA